MSRVNKHGHKFIVVVEFTEFRYNIYKLVMLILDYKYYLMLIYN